ncbi:hypothetical protein GALMADRAFT_144241 [Galerina marginata CBS 339.88]|uniref:DUF6532 domain-containing protein n=1 Tax=Galerina marginata (strain CBS 339.88) TaxID=685588 RepID=A0A067SJP0_GALM3|nr:hypothetical protein GALMADRAFT_144241 [Galerina marginata CBS 339.88]
MPTHTSEISPQFNVQPSEFVKSGLVGHLTCTSKSLPHDHLDVEVYRSEQSLNLAHARRQTNSAEEALARKRLHEVRLVQKAASIGESVTSLKPQFAIDLARAAKETLEAEEALLHYRLLEQRRHISQLEDDLEAVHTCVVEASRQVGFILSALHRSKIAVETTMDLTRRYYKQEGDGNEGVRARTRSNDQKQQPEAKTMKSSGLNINLSTLFTIVSNLECNLMLYCYKSRAKSQTKCNPLPMTDSGHTSRSHRPQPPTNASEHDATPRKQPNWRSATASSIPMSNLTSNEPWAGVLGSNLSHEEWMQRMGLHQRPPQPDYVGPQGQPAGPFGSLSVGPSTAPIFGTQDVHTRPRPPVGQYGYSHTPPPIENSISLNEDIPRRGGLRRYLLDHPGRNTRRVGSSRGHSSSLRNRRAPIDEYGDSDDEYDSYDSEYSADDGADDGVDDSHNDGVDDGANDGFHDGGGGTKKPRPAIKNYQEPLRSIIASSQRLFVAHTFKADIFFPSVQMQSRERVRIIKIADESFGQALAEFEAATGELCQALNIEIDDHIRRLIYSASTDERRALKEISAKTVNAKYAILSPDPELKAMGLSELEARRITVASLLLSSENINRQNLGQVNSMPFTDAVPHPNRPLLRFAHEAICIIARQHFLEKENAIGRVFLYLFSAGFPIGYIALVITAMVCHLKSWASGKKKRLDFTGKTFRPIWSQVYDALMDALADPYHGPLLRQEYRHWWIQGLKMFDIDTDLLQPLHLSTRGSFQKTYGQFAYRSMSASELAATFSVSASGELTRKPPTASTSLHAEALPGSSGSHQSSGSNLSTFAYGFGTFPNFPDQPAVQNTHGYFTNPNQLAVQNTHGYITDPNQLAIQNTQGFFTDPNQLAVQNTHGYITDPNQLAIQNTQGFFTDPNQLAVQNTHGSPANPQLNFNTLSYFDARRFPPAQHGGDHGVSGAGTGTGTGTFDDVDDVDGNARR